jgi:cellulose synthase/poly-beta-1,6-N-acetylglucosamine synthase-like glycosyltransferase
MFYFVLILICCFGWFSAKSYVRTVENRAALSLSVIVCCRNERETLPFFLRSLAEQMSDIEQIIFANDHSEDATLAVLQDFAERFSNVKLFSTNGFGKKNALREAMQFADGEYVITFDADCVVPQNYFLSAKDFLAARRPDLMIGGVKFAPSASLFERLQALEFASLIASGAGFALARMPIMCNGTNLAFRRLLWQDASKHLVDKEVSGDDIFLLHYVKKIGGRILFFKFADGFVETFAVKTFGEFFRQRRRWASKSRSYSDLQTIFVALVVFGFNFLLLLSAFGAFFSEFLRSLFFILFFGKFLTDSLLLVPFLIFTKQKRLIKLLPLLSIFYPFYIVFTVVFSFFGKIKWKNY